MMQHVTCDSIVQDTRKAVRVVGLYVASVVLIKTWYRFIIQSVGIISGIVNSELHAQPSGSDLHTL